MLPEEPVLRAKMRAGILLVDAYGPVYYPIYMKKAYDEAIFTKVREVIGKIESFIAANKKEGSAFALGTKNPTQLDVHIYTHLGRHFQLEGTKMDFVFAGTHAENYPLIRQLIAAFRARPEFKGVLSNQKPLTEMVARHMDAPEGVRVMLSLPCDNSEE